MTDVGKQVWIQRDAEGNVVGSTEVRSSSGCAGCFWVLLGLFVVAAPAVWAGNGTIPVAAAVVMYLIEALIVIAALVQRERRGSAR